MSYSAEPGLERRLGAGIFEPGLGLPSKDEIHASWLHAGAASLDENGAIITVNDELAAWLGAKTADLVGYNFGEVLGKRDAACGKKFVELWQIGGAFAQAAAKALARHTPMPPREIAQHAMTIASEICIYTNANLTIEEL